jgi:beta-lactamase regulating signal transducer with metallopeptidase domain
METLFESKGMALLVEFFLKSSLVLGIALCLSFLLRKQSASVRHFLLGLSLVGLLVLPFLSAFMPGWQTDLLPSWRTGPPGQVVIDISSHQGELASSTIAPLNRDHVQAKNPKYSTGEETVSPGAGWLNPLYRYGFTALWCLVSGLLLVRILLGLYGALRLTRRGIPLKGYPWQQLFLWFSTNTLKSLKRKVRMVKSKGIAVPMTWGVLKPVVLMPPSSCQWPLEQCSSVLFHELSHVKRWDFLTAVLCRISCCLYWFNPLSWMVFKRLRMEQEKACDEMVLQTGIKPSTYASSLLSLKQAIDNRHYRQIPALGMAGSSELHERLTTILEKQIKIKEIKMKTKMMLLILIVLAVALIGTARPNQTFSAVTKETAVTPKTGTEKVQTAQTAQTEETAQTAQTAQTEEAEKKEEKKEKGKKEEKKVTIIMRDGRKDKAWFISEIANGKEIVLKHLKSKKDIKYKVISDNVMVITDEKDSGKNFHIYKKGEGKEGEGGHYIIVEKGVETIDIKMLDQDDHYVVILDKDQGKGHRVKIEILSDNEISGELLEKIKKMTKELQKNLPGSYKLETDFSKTSQGITFRWPLKLDKKTHVEALKHFSAFAKELKKLLSSSKGSKPLKKHITIAPKEKDSEG